MTSSQANTSRALLATCVAAAARAADIIRAGAENREQIQWVQKAKADFVSEIDRTAEQAITETVAGRHPDARVLGEEFSPRLEDQSGLLFVVDPLDGTTNFLHGFPWYAVSIAAVVDGVIQAGVVLNAANGELFTATAGGGARRGGQPIHVSQITEPSRALIGTGFPFAANTQVDEYLQLAAEIMRGTAGLRRPGSAALDLADVACGRFDAFWELRLNPWDIAAGILLVREAGGIVTDRNGAHCRVATTSVVAGNPAMHAWLLDKVGPGEY